MEYKKHILTDVWKKYPEAISNKYSTTSNPVQIEHLVAEIFTSGPFYYYMINISNSTLSDCNDDLLKMHGLTTFPVHLKDIIDLIHPDDLGFVMEAEAWTIEMYKIIGFEHQLKLKSGYCFRMKAGNGEYELFHHQAFHTLKDENGRLLQALNIHTNIHHITRQNNYIVTISGIGNRKDFYQKQLIPERNGNVAERLTKREIEILNMLVKGYTDREIAEVLNISFHTVRTHHKNILGKTKSKNSAELIKRSLENGYL